MAEKDKKYYWLKLKRDFFKRHDIQIIEDMPNGKDYILFYLKLLCESVDHEGNLRFNDEIPYNEQMLSTITRTNVDVVRSAIKVFESLKMIEILDDGTYYMNEVNKMLGSETYWAEQKRLQREKENEKKVLEKPNNDVGQCPTCPSKSKSIEKDKDKELDKELKKEIENDNDNDNERIVPRIVDEEEKGIKPQEIVDLFNSICKSYSKVIKLTDNRKKSINARLKEKDVNIETFKMLFTKAEESNFLKGNSERGFKADFDWLINQSNFYKTLEGKYDNRVATYNNNNNIKHRDIKNDSKYKGEMF